ncbi:uncharacterized protein RJT20DRAFT_95858 [Scheffersomyces xylosifermentans]|uniref:uncharacterized protein n=1 Tax=Scheffersomyces xylosifermentans TaxID=1304137 RepID=UPI00315D9987
MASSKLELAPNASSTLLTPPPTSTSSPISKKEVQSPNHFKYYTNHLNKTQFNLILINCSINLVKILYKDSVDVKDMRFFVIEILRRSKTSIQSLQLACYYLFKLIKDGKNVANDPLLKDYKKLFLGLIILASKFNQDSNYAFKSWLKICGIKDDDQKVNLKTLREVETKCLGLLNYDLYLNGLPYENWCNILIIFGYDFISYQVVNDQDGENEIHWESNDVSIANKLSKWNTFFRSLNVNNLNVVKINFNSYYANQMDKKIFVNGKDTQGSIPSLFHQGGSRKRSCGEDAPIIAGFSSHKKLRVETI